MTRPLVAAFNGSLVLAQSFLQLNKKVQSTRSRQNCDRCCHLFEHLNPNRAELEHNLSQIPGCRCEEDPGGSPPSRPSSLSEVDQPGHHRAAGDGNSRADISHIRILSRS